MQLHQGACSSEFVVQQNPCTSQEDFMSTDLVLLHKDIRTHVKNMLSNPIKQAVLVGYTAQPLTTANSLHKHTRSGSILLLSVRTPRLVDTLILSLTVSKPSPRRNTAHSIDRRAVSKRLMQLTTHQVPHNVRPRQQEMRLLHKATSVFPCKANMHIQT